MMRYRAGFSRGFLSVLATLALLGLTATAGFSQAAPQLLPYIVTTVAGTGSAGTCATSSTTIADCTNMGVAPDGSSLAINAKLAQPYAVAVDSLGQMYIGAYDGSVGYVFRVDTTGHISLFAGGMKAATAPASTCATGTDIYGSGCPANQTSNKGVRGIAFAPNGDMYYGDFNNHIVFKVDHTTGVASVFAGTGGTSGWVEGLPGTGQLSNPYGIAFDRQATPYLFVAEKGKGTVDSIDPQGYIHHVVGNGTRFGSGAQGVACPIAGSGLAKDTQLVQPSDVAFDQAGNLYVADYYCYAVYKVLVNPATGIVDANSNISIFAGANSDSGTLKLATGTGWQDPLHSKETSTQSVAVDFNNNVYIGTIKTIWFCDSATNTCHSLIGSEGTTPTGCQANTTSPYDGCPGPLARLSNGSQILAFDPWGNLYFTDTSSSSGLRVRKLWVGTNGSSTVPNSSGSSPMLVHYGANDAPATTAPITGAVDFGLGFAPPPPPPSPAPAPDTCTTNPADNTQDCTIWANFTASSSLVEPFTLTSALNGTSAFYMTNNLYPTCQNPTAADQSITPTNGTATFTLSGQLGAGCSGIELYPPTPHKLSYSVVQGPSNGTVNCNGANCTYVANPGYVGQDSFTFTANDGSGYVLNSLNMETPSTLVSAPATVNILAADVPVAIPQSGINVSPDTPATITLAATGDGTITYSIVSGPSHGTVGPVNGNQVVYTPNTGYFGQDSFTFKATNNSGDSAPATISLNVLASAPVANPQSVTVAYNTPATITLSANGAPPLNYTVVTQPSHGQLLGNAPYLTYTPGSTYSGTDSFTFKATDSYGQDSAPVTVSLTVNGPDMLWATASGGSTTQTVSAGRTALFFLQLTGWSGSSATVNFSCSGAPANSICTVGPNSATMNGTAPIPVTVSIVTSSHSQAAAGPIVPSGPGNGFPLSLAVALTALLASLLFVKKGKMQWRLTGACAALLLTIALSACGGSSNVASQVTAAGTYTVTVTATSGSVTKTTTVTLNVQ